MLDYTVVNLFSVFFFPFLKPSESEQKKAPGSVEPIVFFSEDNEFEYKEEK